LRSVIHEAEGAIKATPANSMIRRKPAMTQVGLGRRLHGALGHPEVGCKGWRGNVAIRPKKNVVMPRRARAYFLGDLERSRGKTQPKPRGSQNPVEGERCSSYNRGDVWFLLFGREG